MYQLTLVVSKYYSIWKYRSSGSILFRFWKGIPGIWDLSKTQRGIRETLTGYGIWLRTFKAGFTKIWSRNGIGKENDIQDSDDRSSGCGIPVRKRRDCGIRPPHPLLERTVFMIVRYTSYNSTLLLLVNNMGTYSLNPRKRYCGVTIQPLWEKSCIVDSWIYFIRILTLKFAKFFKNILGNPRLRFWKGCSFVCSKTVNTTQLCFQLIPSSERQNLPTRRKNLH